MRTGSLLIALAASCGSALAADCGLPNLKDKSSDHPECLFYVGTQNFREKNYAAAFGSWERLRNLEEVAPEFQEFKTLAYNNLGYLLYMGWGTKANTQLAIEYWKLAYNAGHDESTYHLCHAYGEIDRPEYSPKLALGYCEEAIRRYKQSSDAEDEKIVQQLHKYVSRLKAQ